MRQQPTRWFGAALIALVGCGSPDPCEVTWYADADGDGFGDPLAPTRACEAPRGHVRDARDCDDADPDTHPDGVEACNARDDDCDGQIDEQVAARWFPDADGDGYGRGAGITSCDPPLDHALRGGDCDDADASTHPDAAELCDGRDNDCDGDIDDGASDDGAAWVDDDGDGFGGDVPVSDCASAPGVAAVTGDCDDTRADIHPGRSERCNGVDDDCDGTTDEEAVDASTWYDDADGDGFGDPATGETRCDQGGVRVSGDCDDQSNTVFPNAPERCNGVDDDCDTVVDNDAVGQRAWYLDLDGDGYGAGGVLWACVQPPQSASISGDCDDRNPLAHPGAPEIPHDAVDGDCDGLELCLLDADFDGAGGEHLLASRSITCALGYLSNVEGDCEDDNPEVGPLVDEVPYDGIDNDCDPTTRDDDLDGDGFLAADDCDDLDPDVIPGVVLEPHFVDVTETAGLQRIPQWDGEDRCDTRADFFTGAAAVGDVNGDGWEDLFMTRQEKPDTLFLNQGDGTFVEAGAAAGVDFVGSTNGALFVDLDGDGDLDLYTTSIGVAPHRAYINDGSGHFTEEAAVRGLDVPPGDQCSMAFSVSAADIDNDGDLDLHTTAWNTDRAPNDRSRLLVNDGLGTFTDITDASGLDLLLRATFATAFGDLDGDGWVDMALASDWSDTTVWRNARDGTFEDITATALGEDLVRNGMGQDMADVDNDGDLDWFVSAVYHPWINPNIDGNRLFINDGHARFRDEAEARGVVDGGWAWGSTFVDFDNDGSLDLLVTNGFGRDLHDFEPLRFFVNDGTQHWDEQACVRGVSSVDDSRGVVAFDYDHDGDLDLLITNNETPPRLLRNEGGNDNGWLTIELRDAWPNPFAVGAAVYVQTTPEAPVLRRDVHANSTFGSTAPPVVHFGLGGHHGLVHEVRIVWPGAREQVLLDVAADQRLVITSE